MLLTQDFFLKYNNKGIDFDNYYGFQCMDLYQQYNKEVVGGKYVPVPAAVNVWDKYPSDSYTKIANTPNNFPEQGDIIIWNKNAGGGFGHIAVCYTANINSFVSFDQNWPVGSLCHFQNHNYANVVGWLRPKTQATAPIPMISQKQIIIDAYKALTGEFPNDDELAWRLKQNLNSMDLITDICKGDSRFYNKWVKPYLK